MELRTFDNPNDCPEGTCDQKPSCVNYAECHASLEKFRVKWKKAQEDAIKRYYAGE